MVFIIQLIFTGIAVRNSYDDLPLIIASTVISFLWIGAFTANALRHGNDAYYPAVALASIAVPSYFAALFVFAYMANFLGYNILRIT
jgi:hypothetical protein